MARLRPFFKYKGSKWSLAPKYPAPIYPIIIEPFAGSAGYSTTWFDRDIRLVDTSEYVYKTWDFLIKRGGNTRLPCLDSPNIKISDLCIPDGAKYLIGFWCWPGCAIPRSRMPQSAFNVLDQGSFWCRKVADRIQHQSKVIKHWSITKGEYRCIPNQKATWFIDPPYQNHKDYYGKVDYSHLAEWCKSRKGQVIVCESLKADWLDFEFFVPFKMRSKLGGRNRGMELIWYREQ